MSRSPYDPHPHAPRTLRERLGRKFKRTVEPLAIHLLDWCRSLHGRLDNVESRAGQLEARADRIEAQSTEAERQLRGLITFLDGQVRSALGQVCALDGQVRAAAEKLPGLEAAAADGRARLEAVLAHFYELSQRTDQAEWGRQAIIERLNRDDARVGDLAQQVEALDKQMVESYWAREALVERLGEHGSRQELLGAKLEAHVAKIDDQLSLPLAFGLDALAMGRRIAALEDQVEALLGQLARENPALGATLVAFPQHAAEPEKAAG